MFDNNDDAEELNSECNFCGLTKFEIVEKDGKYDLVRCTDASCTTHCHWGHDVMITQEYLNNADAVAIASGW